MKKVSSPIIQNRGDAWLSVCIVLFQKFKNPMTKKDILRDAEQSKQNIENEFYKLLTLHLIYSGKPIIRDESERNEKNPIIARHNVINKDIGTVFSNYNFTVEANNVNKQLENTLRIFPKNYYSLEWYCEDAPILYALEKTLLGEKIDIGFIQLTPAKIIPFYLEKNPAILFKHSYLEISFEIADYYKFGILNKDLYEKAFGSSFDETLTFLKKESQKQKDQFTKKWLSDVEKLTINKDNYRNDNKSN